MQPMVSIVGKANSGKTRLLRNLIAELKKRGLSMAVIKHAGEDFEIDTEGKDTWHFRQAGAETVAISSPHQVAIMKKVTRDLDLRELSRAVDDNYDLIITEGFKQENTCKIEVHRAEQGKDLVSNSEQLLAVVTDEPLEVAVPQFSGEEVSKIADLIEQKVLKIPREDDIELYVNDSLVTMNPFVKKILISTLTGFISSLKGVSRIKDIRVLLRKNSDI
ncbi:molybdopterin-guanine dinucleotide biosynthesis protein B [Chloroflexota bacterium]